MLTDKKLNKIIFQFKKDNCMPTIQDLEMKLGLEHGFLMALKEEKDNWSFILKTAAVAEGAVKFALDNWFSEDVQPKVNLIDAKSNDDYKKVFFEALGPSFEKRIGVAYSFGLINNKYSKLLCTYFKLRNTIVHNINNHGFDFVKPIDKKLHAALKKLLDQIKTMLNTEIDRLNQKSIRESLFNIIFFSCCQLSYGKVKNEKTGKYEFINVGYADVKAPLPIINVSAH